MDLRGQIAKYPGEPEDRLMLSHALDVLERGRLKNRLFATDFLTPREQALIRQQLGILEPVFSAEQRRRSGRSASICPPMWTSRSLPRRDR